MTINHIFNNIEQKYRLEKNFRIILIEILSLITSFYVIVALVIVYYANHRISEINTEKYYWKRKYYNFKENGVDSFKSEDEKYF